MLEDAPAVEGTTRRGAMPWVVTLLGISLFAVLAVLLAWWDRDNEQRLLDEQTDQAGVVLTVSINQFLAPLSSLAEAADATDGDADVFTELADRIMGDDALPYSAITLLEPAADEVVAQRGGPVAIDEAGGLMGVEPPADGTVGISDLLAVDRTLGFATQSPSQRYVVYAERRLTTDPTVRQRNDGPFANLDYAIYLGATADDDRLLGASTAALPLDRPTSSVTVPYGDSDILIVTSPVQRLGAPLLAHLWWIVLTVGVAITVAIVVLLARLQRSRQRALELARLNELQHLEQRDIAETLQLELLPQGIAPPPGLRMATRYWVADTASLIGGDTYDVFRIDDTRWAILVGDVCGKGTEAAALTGLVRHTIRTALLYVESPADALRAVHTAMADHRPRTYCTAALMIYRPDDPSGERPGGELTVALGGHPAPLLRTVDGTVRPIGRAGTILGMIDPDLHDECIRLDPGSILLIYTDGLTDAAGGRALTADDLATSMTTSRDVDEIANDIRRRRADRGAGGTDDTAVLVLALDLDRQIAVVPAPTDATPALS